eukprot:TRINITY_DN4156_c0_g1_i5.p1 TRINITY_DN4156_c0_g1~~TRINITY_DN4156_c0_g1_i5.p1  ORF type:complete len:1283 (+),score=262.04 TRINITY_DN4156_c0_g1_i5:125-3973(+)
MERLQTTDRLSGPENWGVWKILMEDILQQKGCKLALKTKAQAKADLKMDDAAWLAFMPDAKWDEINSNALSFIRPCLSNSILKAHSRVLTAQELWQKLKDRYDQPSMINRYVVLSQAFTTKMKEGTKFLSHLDEMQNIFSQIDDLGITFTEEMRITAILISLPQSWSIIVTPILTSAGKNSLTLEELIAMLLDIEKQNVFGSSSSEKQGEALATHRGRSQFRGGHGRSKSTTRSQGRDIVCHYCKKKGHMIKDCWKLKDKRKKRDEKNKDASSSAPPSDSEADIALLTQGGDVNVSAYSVPEVWIIDTGASFHVCPSKAFFSSYEPITDGSCVWLGDDRKYEIEGKGTVVLMRQNGQTITLTNVRHVPGLTKNLISVGQLSDGGFTTTFDSSSWKISKGALVIARGSREGTMYVLRSVNPGSSACVASGEVAAGTWHKRLGHLSETGLQVLISKGLLPKVSLSSDFCSDCVIGKSRRVNFRRNSKRLKQHRLELIHSDLVGPIGHTSLGGVVYFITFVDDFSRKLWLYPLKSKDEAFQAFRIFKARVENETGCKIKELMTDNGGEFTSKEFENFCREAGIIHHRTVPRTPQQNGVAERQNRTILERVRAVLTHSGLPKQFWAEVASTIAYLLNRCPHNGIDGQVPECRWSGSSISYSHLRMIGCEAYAHQQSASKLGERARKCVFLGYGGDDRGYRLWDPVEKKVFRSRDVVFNEDIMYFKSQERNQNEEMSDPSTFPKPDSIPNQFRTQHMIEDDSQCSSSDEEEEEVEHENVPEFRPEPEQNVENFQTPDHWVRRSTRPIRPPARYSPSLNYILYTDAGEPESYQEAICSPDASKWMEAMNEEMESFERNHTWEVMPLPPGKRALKNRWIYRLKQETNGAKRYRARMVVKGFAQQKGIDFNEIFSPVVKHTSIRIILAMVACMNLELEQLDIKTAFLHGDLQEEIYMEQPEGFGNGKDLVCRLKRSLYGLKQAPRQWYKKFDTFMIEQKYERCKVDHCVYLMRTTGKITILLLYVDDMLIAGNDLHEIQRLKSQMAKKFATKDLGQAKQILGMRIERDRKSGKLWLSQSDYIHKVLKRFNMADCSPVSTPLAGHFKLSKEDCPISSWEKKGMMDIPYTSVVGSLMYAMVCTRPDLAQAVGVVSRYMSNPGRTHWEAVKWMLRYLKGTQDHSLCFGGSGLKVVSYSDANFAGCGDTRKSTTGYVFTLGGGAVSWMSRLQSDVALSTTEAEYIALTETAKEMIWLRRMLEWFGLSQNKYSIYCDSQSVVHLARNVAFHARTK